AGLDLDVLAGLDGQLFVLDGPLAGVEHRRPAVAPTRRRDGERHWLVVRIEEHEERIVGVLLAAPTALDGVAVEEDSDRLGVALVPVALFHLVARRREPRDVADVGPVDRASLEERAATKHSVTRP